MFQFPGFALKTLCIQVISTCLTPLLIAESNNNRISSGLPHSEIHGSKLILSSPWLIAEYHVLHRLLLPRHPPNALLALDPIQKETDIWYVLPRGTLLEDNHALPCERQRQNDVNRDRYGELEQPSISVSGPESILSQIRYSVSPPLVLSLAMIQIQRILG